jgi:hypothetical protein
VCYPSLVGLSAVVCSQIHPPVRQALTVCFRGFAPAMRRFEATRQSRRVTRHRRLCCFDVDQSARPSIAVRSGWRLSKRRFPDLGRQRLPRHGGLFLERDANNTTRYGLRMPDERESDVAMAARHVAEGRRIVDRQRERIAQLKIAGHETVKHEEMLRVLENTLQIFEDHHRQLGGGKP